MLDEEPAAALDTALQGDQGSLTLAAGWPMASPVFNQGRNHTANPGRERRRRARSEHTGIAVKCRRNIEQLGFDDRLAMLIEREAECCFAHFPVEPPRELTALFRRRIAWDGGAIREAVGAGGVAFVMKDCC